MEIFIEDIPAEGLTVEARVPGAGWLKKVMCDILKLHFSDEDEARLAVECHRTDENVDVTGALEYTLHPICDRCLKRYGVQAKLQLNTHLAPLYESERQKRAAGAKGEEVVLDDEDFSYYQGDCFELGDLLREQLLLSQPMKNLCREDCLGLCQRCGMDLNEGECECTTSVADPRWEPLKDLREKLKKS